jgi:hypothetical protein
MSDAGLITVSHRSRAAVIYVRQSTLAQVERNRESTTRQYDLVQRAAGLGWPRTAIRVIDADLGVTGSVTGQRRWSPRSPSARSGSSWHWRSPGWPATTRPGTGCWTWPVPATRWSPTLTAFIIPVCSTTGWSWG